MLLRVRNCATYCLISLLIASIWLSGTATAEESLVALGRKLVATNGCGSCHEIPGIYGASGLVGPPLGNIGRRVYIAGVLPNTPENLASWVENPQAYVPGNAMPNMGLTRQQGRAIAAYLETLR